MRALGGLREDRVVVRVWQVGVGAELVLDIVANEQVVDEDQEWASSVVQNAAVCFANRGEVD